MGKRKRDVGEQDTALPNGKAARSLPNGTTSHATRNLSTAGTTLQVVTGSYERTLHGIVVHAPDTAIRASAPQPDTVTFADSFLFNAHTSSIRCLALSPPSEAQKVFLASGGTDERINIYSLTTVPPEKPQARLGDGIPATRPPPLEKLSRSTATSAANKEVGTLNHHSATVTSLSFPTRTKLLSGAADNTITVLRTRDWEILSSLRAPVPKPAGRPSGDTAAPGEVPAGINDVAIHPSLKLMLTVGRGEKCMRLWNLVTGKKAGVLQFDRGLLAQVGEGKHGSGEGRRALWDADGELYTILFERGACVFGIDSKPRAVILPQPPSKLHQLQYLGGHHPNILVLSTEDGRLLFCDVSQIDTTPSKAAGKSEQKIPECPVFAQLGGRERGVPARIKDFKILRAPSTESNGAGATSGDLYLAVTACSDGTVQLWTIKDPSNRTSAATEHTSSQPQKASAAQQGPIPYIGTLVGTYETGNRITCLQAFVMDGKVDDTDKAAGSEPNSGSLLDKDSDESE